MNPVRRYLRLFGRYRQYLGVCWSQTDNVMEFQHAPAPVAVVHWQKPDELVDFSSQNSAPSPALAFAEEIADFLEGFAAWRPIVHFAFIAHLFVLLRRLPPEGHTSSNRLRLWKLVAEHGVWWRHASAGCRHAGALCAQLCRAVPEAVEATVVPDICQRLRRHDGTIRGFLFDPGETLVALNYVPPWSPEDFETHVLKELDRFTDADVQFWLEHGRGPIPAAAETLARALPLSLSGRLARLLERPRLAGAQAFIKQLSAALALPPRRLTHEELPVGGYTNVTTRGKIEQLLPSQFALDEWDFFRRYAEHELLYFRREDPNAPTRHDLIVLLDQGVRTWGDVRLVLGAALLALAKNALRGGVPFLLATTGSSGIVDPLDVTEEELGKVLEASDLSSHPGLALETLLERPTEFPRDIVLLTHPRSLLEDDVQAAAKRVRPDTRLFALSLDRLGQATLNEVRKGAAVPVRLFQVDLAPAREPAAPISPSGNFTSWTGDVEPIGFPFLFGIDGRIPPECFDFDGPEKHLLTACHQGLLHLWHVDGGLREMLPRGFFKGEVVTQVAAVLGVADGFVVVGRLDDQWGAVHYHLGERRCRIHPIGRSKSYESWDYSPDHHCFLAWDQEGQGCSVDLSTGEHYATHVGGLNTRARAAFWAWQGGVVTRRRLNLPIGKEPHVTLNSRTGKLQVGEAKPAWSPFVPLSDGLPLLQDCVLENGGQIGGVHVAVQVRSLLNPKHRVHVFRRDGVPVYQGASRPYSFGFRLSRSGELLAHQLGNRVIEFGPVDQRRPMRRTDVGGFGQNFDFMLSDRDLVIFPGTRRLLHYLKWPDGRLSHAIHAVSERDTPFSPEDGSSPTKASRDFSGRCQYDSRRWTGWAQREVLVTSDRYGQLAVFDKRGRLVCMLIAFRSRLAGWMPDGTCFGPPLLTGMPSTPTRG